MNDNLNRTILVNHINNISMKVNVENLLKITLFVFLLSIFAGFWVMGVYIFLLIGFSLYHLFKFLILGVRAKLRQK